MTGPEHYLKAEELAVWAYQEGNTEWADRLLARAAVHATLALTAATALGAAAAHGGVGVDVAAWDKVCGVPANEVAA